MVTMAKTTAMLLLSVPIGIYLLLSRESEAAETPGKPGKPTSPPVPVPSLPPPDLPTIEPGSFLASLPELARGEGRVQAAEKLRKRNDLILAEVIRKKNDGNWGNTNLYWTKVFSSHGPLSAEINVTNDALVLEGVRVDTDFLTAQRIADVLGVFLITPHVLDLVQQQAGIKILPELHSEWMKDGTGSYTGRMIEHSAGVDQRIKRARSEGAPGAWKGTEGWNNELVNNAGKHWVMTRRNWEKPKYGANYGWYDYRAPDKIMWQGPNPGLAHDITHVDYSQTFRAMGPTIQITDANTNETWTMLTEAALMSPEYAPLITGKEGVLPGSRHPSIPLYKQPIV